MRIVVLDAYTANPGDISWEKWNRRGKLTIYDRTAPEDVVRRAADAETVLTNKVVLSAEVMVQLPRLRYIGVLATGYNVVDLEAATRRGIVVTNIPAYSTMSVAQQVFALLLNITNRVALHAESVRRGEWQQSADFSYTLFPLQELEGKTFGIVGVGHIGQAVARIAQSIGMRVMAYSSKSEEELMRMGIERAGSYEQLFAAADVLSLHCPLTEETSLLVNAERLALMKPSAIVINTGRGPLVDEQALADALNEGRIQAAGLDVLTEEPPRSGSPLLSAKNCTITPHVAWATTAARRRLLEVAYDNLCAFAEGHPVNQVNFRRP